MNASDWERLKELLAEAADLPAAERERFVAEHCPDPDLRREVLDLLASPAPLSGVVGAASLPPGARLGPYVVERLVGRGGMGEVYRARDSRIGRDVAIKVLPPAWALHRDRLDRFAREATLLGALNHPHICTLHDIGSDRGTDFLVMEYLEGESLADRLSLGPLQIRDALTIGIQIAGALDKAHASGIVHRDLKPGNVMLTKAGAKLLDFGLARIADSDHSQAPLPTQTAEGAVIGTWQYMAPEQVEGRKTDARTDIWALGCLLYEMVTGSRAFDGSTQAGLIAAILEREPPPAPTNQPLPRPLDHVIRRCLAKSADDRWQSAADVRHELAWIAESSGVPADGRDDLPPRRFRGRAWLGWAVAALLALGTLAAFGVVRWRTSAKQPVLRFTIDVPDAAGAAYLMQVSPDGRWLAYTGYHPGSTTDTLWVRSMDSVDTRTLTGTEGHNQFAFWSPDARALGFFAGGKLKRIDVATGLVQVICDAPDARGGAWGRDGTIVFTPGTFAPLFRVDARGGAPVQLTTLAAAAGEQSHRLPAFAEDGVHFVFTVLNRDGRSSIRIGSLDQPGTADLVNLSAGFNSPTEPTQAFVASGHVVFARGGVIFAQPLDLKALRVVGEPVALATHVDTENFGRQPFSASGRLIVYRRLSLERSLRQLRWIQRNGSAGNPVWKPGDFGTVAIAPDGYRVAVSVANEDQTTSQIWIIDTNRGTASSLTDDVFADNVVWSADGAKLFYTVSRGLTSSDIYSRAADGGAAAELVLDQPATQKRPFGWSADGRLLFTASDVATGRLQVWAVNPKTRRSTIVVEDVKGIFNGDISPDGRFMAFEVHSGDSQEVYVQALAGGPRIQISTGGAHTPIWRDDGKELYYLSNGKLIASEIRYGGAAPVVASSRPLFTYPPESTDYLAGPGGQRFLFWMRTERQSPVAPNVIVNWTSALSQGRE